MTITPDNWENVRALFDAALQLNPEERSPFLHAASTDSTVVAEVERLLVEHQEAADFLSVPVLGNTTLNRELRNRLSEGELLAVVASTVAFLASKDASYITGVEINVDGGMGQI